MSDSFYKQKEKLDAMIMEAKLRLKEEVLDLCNYEEDIVPIEEIEHLVATKATALVLLEIDRDEMVKAERIRRGSGWVL
jgi:hypothetical protein